MVNHFCNNFWFDLPKLLSEFFALSLDGLDTPIHNASNSRKAHTCYYHAQNKSNDDFTHYFFSRRSTLGLGSIHLPTSCKSCPAPLRVPATVPQALNATAVKITINVFMLFP